MPAADDTQKLPSQKRHYEQESSRLYSLLLRDKWQPVAGRTTFFSIGVCKKEIER